MITANMATILWEQLITIFGESGYGVGADYQHTNTSEETLTRPTRRFKKNRKIPELKYSTRMPFSSTTLGKT
jgi:hypothetical protein